MLTAVSIIIGMGFVTFMLSLHVYARRVDFHTHQDEYTRMAIRDGITWPYTFVRVVRHYIESGK